MNAHEKKPRSIRIGKSPIATPPRAAIQGRSKTDHHDSSIPDNASTKSTPDTLPSDEASEIDVLESKDKKIAELEKEIATMEDEFERELTQLSHKLTNENETAVFWQQKHSTLNQTFLKVDTDLRLLRQEVSAFQQGREERDRDIKTRISSLMLDRDAFREAYNEAMGDLRGKEEMIRELQGQVRGLKSWVSVSSKMDEQLADEAFGERMQRLGNGLQNWVITNFRRVKIGRFSLFCHILEEVVWVGDAECCLLCVYFRKSSGTLSFLNDSNHVGRILTS
jgi:rubrerythrin